jgi:hypothetical protein
MRDPQIVYYALARRQSKQLGNASTVHAQKSPTRPFILIPFFKFTLKNSFSHVCPLFRLYTQ